METKKIIYLLIAFLLLIILLQNTQIVTVNLFFWEISMSRVILLLLMLGLGFIAGYLVNYRQVKKKARKAMENQQLKNN